MCLTSLLGDGDCLLLSFLPLFFLKNFNMSRVDFSFFYHFSLIVAMVMLVRGVAINY